MKINNEILSIASEHYVKGNSIKDTAEFLGKHCGIKIHAEGLRKRFRKVGVAVRNNKEAITLSRRKHINLSQILLDYKNNKPIREISRKHKIARETTRKILRENSISVRDSRTSLIAMGYIKEKKDVHLSNKEKAYLFGLVMGDLTPVRKSNYTLKLITHSTHKTFIDFLCKIFEKYGPTSQNTTKNANMFRFHTHIGLDSFLFLLDSKKEKMPNWINSENFFDFLAGFIDSDGSVMLKRRRVYVDYSIRFFGQNFKLLSQIQRILNTLGYNSSIHKCHSKGEVRYHNGVRFVYNKDYYILETRRGKQTVQLLNSIPIRHPEKILKKELIFKIHKQNIIHWQEAEKEINELRRLIKESVRLKTNLGDASTLDISDRR